MKNTIHSLLILGLSLTLSAEIPKFHLEIASRNTPLTIVKKKNGSWNGKLTDLKKNGRDAHYLLIPQNDEWRDIRFEFQPEKNGEAELMLCGAYVKKEGKMIPHGTYIDNVRINGTLMENGGFEENFKAWRLRNMDKTLPALILSDPGIVKYGEKCALVHFMGALFRSFLVEAGKKYEISLSCRYAGILNLQPDVKAVPLAKQANMAFADPVANDGKGGWTDRGPGDDMEGFQPGIRSFGGMEFDIVDPAKNNGKAILAFAAKNVFPNGLKNAILNLDSKNISGKYLYLLHSASYANSKNTPPIGEIEIEFKNGKKQKITPKIGIDVDDWWRCSFLENAVSVYTRQNAASKVAMYLSKFRLDEPRTPIGSIRITPSGNAIWIVVGASVSDRSIEPVEIAHNFCFSPKIWKKADMPSLLVKQGTALDFSSIIPEEAGKEGFVRIDGKGGLVFSKTNRPVRLQGYTFWGISAIQGGNLEQSHRNADRFAAATRRQGYNLMRFSSLDTHLFWGAKKEMEVLPDRLDEANYLLAAMKKQGIYTFLTIAANGIGYRDFALALKERGNAKMGMLLGDPECRRRWAELAGILLTRKNPYTGLAWKDDPAIVCVELYNEQLAGPAYYRENNAKIKKLLREKFVRRLTEQYRTIQDLNREWTTDYKQFSEVDPFHFTRASAEEKTLQLFFDDCARENMKWYEKTLRDLGYKGLIAQYNYTNNLRDSKLKSDTVDVVIKNGYFQHPSSFSTSGSSLGQTSSLEQNGSYFTDFAGNRILDRPFMVTEHNHAFWNRFQHEDGLLFPAYAALQNFTAVMIHESPIWVRKEAPIRDFFTAPNPVARASEFLATCFYLRGDVRSSPVKIALALRDSYLKTGNNAEGAVMKSQSRISLVTGFGLLFPETQRNISKPEISCEIAPAGTAGISSALFFSNVTGKESGKFDFDVFIAFLKKKGLLTPDNRTNGRQGLYESDTKQIFLNSPEGTMQVATPRSEAVALKQNGSASLPILRVRDTTVPAAVAIASVDGRPLSESRRLVLLYSTCAANSGMDLSGDRTILRKLGTLPVLLETGKLDAELNLDPAAPWKLYPLALDGTRRKELPLTRKDGKLGIQLNTASLLNGPTVFFELAKE